MFIANITMHAQLGPVDAVDQYFSWLSEPNKPVSSLFASNANVSAVVYDSTGVSQLKTLSPAQFDQEMLALKQVYLMKQEPLVLLLRSYGEAASVYCSVWIRFVDQTTKDTLLTKSIQSIRLLKSGEQWLIAHILQQNEHPSFPITGDLWPYQLAKNLPENSIFQAEKEGTDFEIYDPNVVFNLDQVDEPPVYPGPNSSWNELLKSFDVLTTESQGYTPFTVVINEDGGANLAYVGDLSGYQITKATSFVRSMMVWYPAILDAASVKCKLIFYIHE